jgi:large subunit ribosomal protein L5
MSRLKERYQQDVVPALKKEFGYSNVMAVPKIQKVVVNMGLGEATSNVKLIDTGADELGRITGQKPVTRRSKKSIAQFKVRKGGRHDGHAARRAHVGVPRPADEHRAAPGP